MQGYASPDVEKVYQQARALCMLERDTKELFPVLRGLFTFYFVRGNHTAARELAEQCLQIAKASNREDYLVEGYTAPGGTLYYLGELESSRTLLEEGLRCYQSYPGRFPAVLTPQDPGVVCLSNLALVLVLLGYPDQALKQNQKALTLANRLKQPFTIAYAHAHAMGLYQLLRLPAKVAEHASKTIEISTTHGFDIWLNAGLLYLGMTKCEASEFDEGLALLEQCLAARRAAGAGVMTPYFLAQLAEAQLAADRPEDSATAIAEAITFAEENGEHYYLAELYRFRGSLRLKQAASDQASAEKDFYHSMFKFLAFDREE